MQEPAAQSWEWLSCAAGLQVLSTRVINDRDTGVSRGYGFVNMADVPSAQAAMRSLDNYKVSGLFGLPCC